MAVNLHRRQMQAVCNFYLFERYFVFFSYWDVQATVEFKTGPVWYRGPFSYARRPAHFVEFDNTSQIAASFNAALKSRSEPLSLNEYKTISKHGDPVLQELKLRNRSELGRKADFFTLSDFGDWFRVSRLPWKQGQFWPWADWEKILRATPSREEALERLALVLQREFPPRGFEFSRKRGLIPERSWLQRRKKPVTLKR